MKHLTNLFFICILSFITGCDSQKTIEVYDLRCENLRDPLAVDTGNPRLSWKNKSTENEKEQTAYQILVAATPGELSEDKAGFWDSGKVESANSILVLYEGQKLPSGSRVWWKVRVWDETGSVSEWSAPGRFGIGLLDENDWQASYIAFNTEKGYLESPQLYTPRCG